MKRDEGLYGVIGFAITNPSTKSLMVSTTYQHSSTLLEKALSILPAVFIDYVSKAVLRIVLKNKSIIEFRQADGVYGLRPDAVKVVWDEQPSLYFGEEAVVF